MIPERVSSVAVIGAHCDDAVIGCGAMLMQLTRRHPDVVAHVLVLTEVVAGEFPGCELTFGPSSADDRSHRVAFGKIHEVFAGFDAQWDFTQGAAQRHPVFDSIAMDPQIIHGRGHTRLKQIEYLLKTKQVDERLFWVGV